MAEFSVNTSRYDPYKNFKFKLKWDGVVVAGVSKVSPLRRFTEVIEYRKGGDPSSTHKTPGVTHYDAIMMERGVTYDLAFEQWASRVWSLNQGPNPEVSLADFRKNITLQLYNEAGLLVFGYNIFNCWVSEYQALPILDANNPAIAIEMMVLQNEGWERDSSVVEAKEPTLTSGNA
jgi:phage tail-like protein